MSEDDAFGVCFVWFFRVGRCVFGGLGVRLVVCNVSVGDAVDAGTVLATLN